MSDHKTLYLNVVIVAENERRIRERALRAAVRDARDYGASWAEIGSALDMTRQGAQQRFAETSHA